MSEKIKYILTGICILIQMQVMKAQNAMLRNDTINLTMSQYNFVSSNQINYGIRGTDTTIRINDSLFNPRQVDRWIVTYIFILTENAKPINVFYDNGKLFKSYTNWGEGYSGNYSEYYESGQLKIHGTYCDVCPGIKTGTWFYYDESGKLLEEKKSKPKKCSYDRSVICN